MITVRQAEYRAYLTSPVWKAKRVEALAYHGCICNRCKEYGNDVHHKTYERVGGDELMEDLEVLCRECHEVHHKMEKKLKPDKGRQQRGIHRRNILPSLSFKMKEVLKKKYELTTDSTLYAELTYGSNNLLMEEALSMLGCDYYFVSRTRISRKEKYGKRYARWS